MYGFVSGASQKVHLAVIGAFAAAILLFSVSSVEGIPFVWVIQMTGIAAGAAGVYLLVRYALKVYAYEITETGLVSADGRPVIDLTVTQTVGRKRTVVARVSLRDIASVEVLTSAEARARKASWKSLTIFRYESTPFPAETCYITIPEEHSVIALPPDPETVRLLSAAAKENCL